MNTDTFNFVANNITIMHSFVIKSKRSKTIIIPRKRNFSSQT